MNNPNNNSKASSSNYIATNLANDYKKMFLSNITYKIFKITFKILLAASILYVLKFIL